MSHSLRGKSATELARLLASKEISSVELVADCLQAVEDRGDKAIFIMLTGEDAIRQARESDERRAAGRSLGIWDGIPVAWKDLFDIQGMTTTAGSKFYADAAPAKTSAAVVSACSDRGLISLGKTNLSEFAYSGLGLNPHYGTPVNPLNSDVARAPGGSSSGSAVAVASGVVPVAVGTDTAGSVRVPASFCGIAGFKSSQNRYSKDGVFPLSSSLDSLGAFAHCVDDLIEMDAVMRGREASPTPRNEPADLEVLVPETVVLDGVDAEIMARFEETMDRLERAGVKLRRAPFPIFDEVTRLFRDHGTLTVAEAATLHKELLESDDADLMDRRVRVRMLTACDFSAQDYIRLQWERDRLQQAASEALAGKFMLFPTVAITAPPIEELERDDDHFAEVNLLALRNTMLGNYLGTPGVSLPIGSDIIGLPAGATLSAGSGEDDRVLQAARAMEALISEDQGNR